MTHHPRIVAEIRELTPQDDGWARYEGTGRACLVCSCGTVTGFIDKTEVRRVATDHPAAPTKAEVRMPSAGPTFLGFLRDMIHRGR